MSEQAAIETVDDLFLEAETHSVVNTVRHVEYGPSILGILDCIETNHVHAVVMGTTGKRGTDRKLLGSVTEKTVRSATVPVITVREPK